MLRREQPTNQSTNRLMPRESAGRNPPRNRLRGEMSVNERNMRHARADDGYAPFKTR
jgi:hypothetical protein